MVSRHDYLPFGEELTSGYAGRPNPWGGAADDVNQKFTGKRRDAESGLDYFGARYYGSALGRFTSPDEFNDSGITDAATGKVVFSAGPLPYADLENPQSLNKYVYTLNNPLRYTDPDGHCPICVAIEDISASPGGQEAASWVSENAGRIVAGAAAIGAAAWAGGNNVLDKIAQNPTSPGPYVGGAFKHPSKCPVGSNRRKPTIAKQPKFKRRKARSECSGRAFCAEARQ